MGKKTSELSDREWRHAVEQQRQVIEDHEETVGKWKKGHADASAELKGARKRLDRLLRGEEADPPADPDQPELFPEGKGEKPAERQRAAAGERPETDDEKTSTKRGRRGPKGL